MGSVIPVDFKRRRRTHASRNQPPMHGMPGQALAVAVCVACLACLHAPLLMLWSPWLPSRHPRAQRPGTDVEER